MYQPYYIVAGVRVEHSTHNNYYERLRHEDMLREKYAEHSTSMKQIFEAYNEYKNN